MRPSLMRRISGISTVVLLSASFAAAQRPANRILQEIDSGATTSLPGSTNPRIHAARDIGRVDAAMTIQGITLWFQPTPEQKAQLDALVQAQQTPGSPWYHVWLTPAQFAGRFGLSDADLAKVENWLESEGFNIDRVSNGRTSIAFSGTAGQVESAFQTELHRYQIGADTHFANATDLAIPSALAGIVRSLRNLDDFRPAPQLRPSPNTFLPAFTQAQTNAHYLTPKDVATIYDINAAYNAGYTGSGVTIAVVGQTEVAASDISAFQSAAGLTTKAPNMILVPGTGNAAVVPGDEAESDLDLEYSGGTAPGATIDFVYVGNNQNYSVFDSLQYAIDNKLAPILSISYGLCEVDLGENNYTILDAVVEQAATQGQTVVAASGDEGSTACYDPTSKNPTVTAAMEVPGVNYPASSAYAVGVGGTEIPADDASSSNTQYWKSASSSDVVSSALSYIPEQTWNDDSASIGQKYGSQYALSAGGGGISTLTARPSWQTGVPGIPSGTFRLVPDVSLASSPDNAPYLYCTSDTTSWSSTQKASCNSGFRDSASQDLTAAGGTSFATPIFAGMLAIVVQKEGSDLGVANKNLYSLAANASTYASAFHDITLGGNQCTAGGSFCSSAGAFVYAAGTGYDEATGLGSVDFNNLLTAWSNTSGGGGGTGTGSFTLAAANVSVTHGSSATSAITLTSLNSYAGTVAFAVSSTSSSLNTDGCYTVGNATVTANATATATLTIYTSSSSCSGVSGAHSFARHSPNGTAAANKTQQPFGKTIPIGAAAFAGALLFGFRKSRKAWTLLGCLLLAGLLGLALGCGNTSSNSTNSSSTGSTSTDVAAGTYTLTVVGADTTTSSITANTSLTLTVN